MAMVSGTLPASEGDSMRLSMSRSYGTFAVTVERRRVAFAHILVLILAVIGTLTVASGPSAAVAGEVKANGKPIKMVVLGDSLSAGLGLSAADAFPAKLQKALKDKGINVE